MQQQLAVRARSRDQIERRVVPGRALEDEAPRPARRAAQRLRRARRQPAGDVPAREMLGDAWR